MVNECQYNITEDDDHQVSAGQRDEVIVHSSVEVGAADDHIAH